MKAGDTARLQFVITTAAGDGLHYADAAAFLADGASLYYENDGVESTPSYTITPIDEGDDWAATTAYGLGARIIPSTPGAYYYVCTTAGTSAASEPTWDTTAGGTTTDGTAVWTTYRVRGLHTVNFTAEAGQTIVVVRPASDDFVTPASWLGDVQSDDADSIAARLLSNLDSPGVFTAADVDLGSITAGDAYRSDILTIPAAAASQIHNTTDMTGYLISAALKFGPADAADIDITATWISEADRTFRLSWTSMPAAIITEIGTDRSLEIYIDVQVTKADSSEPFTYRKFTATIVWDRNDT